MRAGGLGAGRDGAIPGAPERRGIQSGLVARASCGRTPSKCIPQRWPRSRAGRRGVVPPPWPAIVGVSCNDTPVPHSITSGGRRIAFIDFWPGFDSGEDRWLTRRWFEQNLPGVQVVPAGSDAQVTVFSMFGREHQRYYLLGKGSDRGSSECSTKLVFFTGENVRPPVGKVPLCLSFDHISTAPPAQHVRVPLWVFNEQVHAVLRMHEARLRGEIDSEVLERSGFCSWVASNANMYNARVRLHFVQGLSTHYRQVACGGEVMNNVGGPVKDKDQFLRGYRFNVAFENASHPGYCTEKLLHAFAAGCIPIYWGDPHVCKSSAVEPDFNPKALISAHDFETPQKLIEHVAAVDRDPALLKSYLTQPILSETWYHRLRDWGAFRRGFTELLFHGLD